MFVMQLKRVPESEQKALLLVLLVEAAEVAEELVVDLEQPHGALVELVVLEVVVVVIVGLARVDEL